MGSIFETQIFELEIHSAGDIILPTGGHLRMTKILESPVLALLVALNKFPVTSHRPNPEYGDPGRHRERPNPVRNKQLSVLSERSG